MAAMKVVRRRPRRPAATEAAERNGAVDAPSAPTKRPNTRPAARIDLVAIGSSTGGPAALARVLASLPGDLAVPVVIVQHISEGFDAGLAAWLDGVSPLSVALASDRRPLRAGEVLIAPCNSHLLVSGPDRTTRLEATSPVDGHRPSATVLFRSVARGYGRHALGVILTGMGEDGARGLATCTRRGGRCSRRTRPPAWCTGCRRPPWPQAWSARSWISTTWRPASRRRSPPAALQVSPLARR